MLPKTHAIVGFIASLFIFLVFPSIGIFGFLIIWFSSVLIDVDHYLYFVYKEKKWGLGDSFKWFIKRRNKLLKLSVKERNKYKHAILIFHGFEFWLILALLIIVDKIFLYALIGIAIHMILDFIDLYRIQYPFYAKLSQIVVYHKNKHKKN